MAEVYLFIVHFPPTSPGPPHCGQAKDVEPKAQPGCGSLASSRPKHASQNSSAQRGRAQTRHFPPSSGNNCRASTEAVCRGSHFRGCQKLSLQLGLGHAKTATATATVQLSELPMAIAAGLGSALGRQLPTSSCRVCWAAKATGRESNTQSQHSQQLFPNKFPASTARFESWVCKASVCLMSQTTAPQTGTRPSSWRYSRSTRSLERGTRAPLESRRTRQ